MTIPDFQTLLLPVLRSSEKGEVRISDLIQSLADEFQLTENERSALLSSGRQTTFVNRVSWAKIYLSKAGLVEPTRRAYFQITDRGREVLASSLERIDIRFLKQFPEFIQFQSGHGIGNANKNSHAIEVDQTSSMTPDEIIRKAHAELDDALGLDLLDRVRQAPPDFFERLVVQLLLAMGYGGSTNDAGHALGKSGDGGVDGVIDQDALGLDRIYVQAKRYAEGNNIGSSAIRDFSGSLELVKATKGLFVTTSDFSRDAKDTAGQLGKRIVLIDGRQLARLMIRYSIGCRVEETIQIKKIDEDFFE